MHQGHIYVLKTIIDQYQQIFLVFCNNKNKKHHSFYKRIKNAKKILKDNNLKLSKIKLKINFGLTTNFLKKHKINVILRGYRDEEDLIYEQWLFNEYKKDMPNLKCVLIQSDYAHINYRSSNSKS